MWGVIRCSWSLAKERPSLDSSSTPIGRGRHRCGIKRAGGDRLAVTAPPNGTVAPPGYYLLVVANDEDVPSEGRFLRLGPR